MLFAEVGKAQLPQPPLLRKLRCALIFYFETLRKLRCRLKVFKICCALIALLFQNFFRLMAQFFTLNLILFHFDRNIDKSRPLANYLLFFCQNRKKCGICMVL